VSFASTEEKGFLKQGGEVIGKGVLMGLGLMLALGAFLLWNKKKQDEKEFYPVSDLKERLLAQEM